MPTVRHHRPTPAAHRHPPLQPPPPPAPPAPQSSPPPTVFEDIGDVLDELLPGEQVASVVRPRKVPSLSAPASSPVATMIAIVLGGICALPGHADHAAAHLEDKVRGRGRHAP